MNKKAKKGFTLVELVIVIAVIAILSSVLIPVFGNVISDAKLSAAKQSVSNAISQFTMNQAAAGNDATIGDGYIYVFEDAQDENNENNEVTPQYIFKYQGGELQDTTDTFESLAKADGARYKLNGKFNPTLKDGKVDSFTVTNQNGDTIIAVPLNAEFDYSGEGDPTVTATIWLVYEHNA